MYIGILTLAFIFLFNPAINFIDPLPDLIGWLLIFKALKRVRYISVQMDNAAGAVIKMAWLSFASFVCIFLLPHLDGTMILTITFAVNVMKLLWGVPAFKYIFSGITELSGLYDGHSIYNPLWKSSKEGVHTAERMTYVFIVSSCVLNTVPEFFELSGQSSVILSEGQRTLLSFKPIFYVLCIFVSLIIGIMWLSVIIPFLRRFGKEKDFIDRVKQAYKEKVVDTGKERALTLMDAMFVAIISGMFVVCIMLDDMNIIPRFIMPLLLFVVALLVGRCGYNARSLKIVSISASVLSLIAYILRWCFLVEFSYDSIMRSFAAYDFYMITLGFVIAELILSVLCFTLWTGLVKKIARNDCGRDVLSVDKEKIAAVNATEYKKLSRKATVSMILFSVACTLNIFSFVICHEFPESWIIVTSVSIVWFLYAYSFYSSLRDGIENKYL